MGVARVKWGCSKCTMGLLSVHDPAVNTISALTHWSGSESSVNRLAVPETRALVLPFADDDPETECSFCVDKVPFVLGSSPDSADATELDNLSFTACFFFLLLLISFENRLEYSSMPGPGSPLVDGRFSGAESIEERRPELALLSKS